MSDVPSENLQHLTEDDPALAAWPPEVREAWLALSLPSLEDVLVTQERLAAEIRRQNQEIKRLGQTLATPVPNAGTEEIAATIRELRQAHAHESRSVITALIAVADAVERHAQALAEFPQIVAQIPRKGFLGRSFPWRPALERALVSHAEGGSLVSDKTIQTLVDLGCVRLAPEPGTPFDPSQHRCVETATGTPGHIIRLVRVGWRRSETVLRPADVIVGKSIA